MKILITGGAGYVGSHVIKDISKTFKDAEILVVDNLSTGHREAVLFGRLVEGDLRDREFIKKVVRDFSPEVVLHFAALIVAPESVLKPLEYWENNVVGTLNLLFALKELTEKGRKIFFVFSSSAAVYGTPEKVPVSESAKVKPENPYGSTKAVCEKLLWDFSNSTSKFKFVSLRYFNAAGADPTGELGQSSPNPTHLITRALKTAKGEIPLLEIYGADYPTPDGTPIRDYIHVCDLAFAHTLALKYLLDGGKSDVFNVGYGKGYSVLEVVKMVEKVVGKTLKKVFAERRPGDPIELVADPTKIKTNLGFKPKYDDLEFIVKTAWRWELERRF